MQLNFQDASIIRCFSISLGQDKASEMHPQATCQTNTLSCTKRVFTKLGSCLDWVVCSPLTWLQINLCLNPKWRVHSAYWTWIFARNHFPSWSVLTVEIVFPTCLQLQIAKICKQKGQKLYPLHSHRWFCLHTQRSHILFGPKFWRSGSQRLTPEFVDVTSNWRECLDEK